MSTVIRAGNDSAVRVEHDKWAANLFGVRVGVPSAATLLRRVLERNNQQQVRIFDDLPIASEISLRFSVLVGCMEGSEIVASRRMTDRSDAHLRNKRRDLRIHSGAITVMQFRDGMAMLGQELGEMSSLSLVHPFSGPSDPKFYFRH